MSHNRDRKTNLYKEVVVAGETGKVPKTQGGRERGGGGGKSAKNGFRCSAVFNRRCIKAKNIHF